MSAVLFSRHHRAVLDGAALVFYQFVEDWDAPSE